MKTLLTIATAMLVAVAAHAQGSFVINFKGEGNDIKFYGGEACGPPNGTEGWSVEVLAGPDLNSLVPLGALPLNRTSPAAALGYPNPTVQIFEVASGSTVLVGYQGFLGTSYASATFKGPLYTQQNGGTGPDQTVALVQSPNLPNTVTVGVGTVILNPACIPEAPTWALAVLGLGMLATTTKVLLP